MLLGARMFFYLISCPSDMKREASHVINVIEEFRRSATALSKRVAIEYKIWTIDRVAEAGKSAQAILNRQIVNSADGIIALFGNRLGSPTPEGYLSGTVEEIEILINAGREKYTHVFFKDNSLKKKSASIQGQQVDEYKKNWKGIYDTFHDIRSLESITRKTLENDLYNFSNAQEEREIRLCSATLDRFIALTSDNAYEREYFLTNLALLIHNYNLDLALKIMERALLYCDKRGNCFRVRAQIYRDCGNEAAAVQDEIAADQEDTFFDI